MEGTQTEKSTPTKLLTSHAEAELAIARHLEAGQDLLEELPATSRPKYDAIESKWLTWYEYSRDLLRKYFAGDRVLREFVSAADTRVAMMIDPTIHELSGDLEKRLTGAVRYFDSLQGRLPLFDLPEARVTGRPDIASEGPVFVVHGRDNEPKQAVARFVERLGLDVVILHEKPSAGATLIEKLERHSAVSFAVVILSPDDVGCLAEDAPTGLKPRPRQNVLFELGFFIGLLGRAKVCALLTAGLERPSDIDGVVYISMATDAWRLELGRELKQVFVNLDMNLAI